MLIGKFDRKVVAVTISLIVCNINSFAQNERSQIPDRYKWDLRALYESDDAWGNSRDKIIAELPSVEVFKGTLTRSAGDLLKCLDFFNEAQKVATRLYSYSSLSSDLDTRDMKYSGMKKELQQIFSDFSARASYVNPEILSMDWQKVEQFIRDEPKLEVYRKNLKDLFR